MEAVKESVRHYWDQKAEGFDQDWGHGLKDDRHRGIWLDILGRNVSSPQPARILDMGCGTGFLSLLLTGLGHQVTGMDFSPQMLAVAREKADRAGVRIDYIQGDAEDPPAPEGAFDYVICRHLIWTLPHPQIALTRWRRLLVPGGGLVLVEGHWRTKGWSGRARRILADLIQMVEERKRPEAWEKTYVPDPRALPLFGGRPAAVLSELLGLAGYGNIWKDELGDLLTYERDHFPLSYRVRMSKSQERRFLLGARNDMPRIV